MWVYQSIHPQSKCEGEPKLILSELIQELTDQMTVTGDTEVRVHDTLNQFDAPIGEVRFCPDGGWAEVII